MDVQNQDLNANTSSAQVSPNIKAADSADIPIDPRLLDGSENIQQIQSQPAIHGVPTQGIHTQEDDPAPIDPQAIEVPEGTPSVGENLTNTSMTASSTLTPWALNTSNLQVTDSQPPSSSTSTPLTPGLGADGLCHGKRFDLSRQSSMSDFSSYLGATKGFSSAPSSEDGYDMGDAEYKPDGQTGDGQGGIPPPKVRKSHARKVGRVQSNAFRGELT